MTLWVGNDTVLELLELTDVIAAVVQSDATVAVTLKDTAGVAVAGQVWPATMSAISGTAGGYRATLSADLEVTHANRYVADIAVQTSGGITGRWQAPVIARA